MQTNLNVSLGWLEHPWQNKCRLRSVTDGKSSGLSVQPQQGGCPPPSFKEDFSLGSRAFNGWTAQWDQHQEGWVISFLTFSSFLSKSGSHAEHRLQLGGHPSGKPSSTLAGCSPLAQSTSLHVPFSFLPEYRTVDTLLQQMFESEIAPEDETPSLDEILNFSPSDIYPKNPSFENSAWFWAVGPQLETKISCYHLCICYLENVFPGQVPFCVLIILWTHSTHPE